MAEISSWNFANSEENFFLCRSSLTALLPQVLRRWTDRQAFYWMIVANTKFSRWAKLSTYQSVYIPTLIYGHELSKKEITDTYGETEFHQTPDISQKLEEGCDRLLLETSSFICSKLTYTSRLSGTRYTGQGEKGRKRERGNGSLLSLYD